MSSPLAQNKSKESDVTLQETNDSHHPDNDLPETSSKDIDPLEGTSNLDKDTNSSSEVSPLQEIEPTSTSIIGSTQTDPITPPTTTDANESSPPITSSSNSSSPLSLSDGSYRVSLLSLSSEQTVAGCTHFQQRNRNVLPSCIITPPLIPV
jgi:hypothetical protein